MSATNERMEAISKILESSSVISQKELVELVAIMIETRAGEVITTDVAYERARNIAQALTGLSVK